MCVVRSIYGFQYSEIDQIHLSIEAQSSEKRRILTKDKMISKMMTPSGIFAAPKDDHLRWSSSWIILSLNSPFLTTAQCGTACLPTGDCHIYITQSTTFE